MKLISTTIINAPISKTPKGKKTSIIQIHSPQLWKDKIKEDYFKSYSNEIMRDYEIELKREFNDFSARSEIFSILKIENSFTFSSVSNSITISQNCILNSKEFLNSFDNFEDESHIPIRSWNPFYKTVRSDEDDEFLCLMIKMKYLKKM